MRINADLNSDALAIRGYSPGAITIQDLTHHHPILLSGMVVTPLPGIARAVELTREHADQLLGLAPEVVLVGTPHADDWPDAAWRAHFLARGVGVEIMNTGAACRTYNVLASEGRRVAAVMLP